MMRLVLIIFAATLISAAQTAASTVGERHLKTNEASAALRDAGASDQLRITVWHPAKNDAAETLLDIGPPGKPLFKPGSAAPDASFEDDVPRPVILLSHGFGGTARMMAWFGTALARRGYIVVAVDHPGNNGRDPMTTPGAILFWERAGDLRAALARVEADPLIAPHLDISRLGVAGFSAGGFAALAAAGGRVDLRRLQAFCTANPADGVCKPQQEFAVSMPQVAAYMGRADMAGEDARSSMDFAIPGVGAVFVMAPALVQAFDPESLSRIHAPVKIILGDADSVAPATANGEAAARIIPGAQLTVLPDVGHYDFIATCTPAGDAIVPMCPTKAPREATHEAAIADALTIFGSMRGVGARP